MHEQPHSFLACGTLSDSNLGEIPKCKRIANVFSLHIPEPSQLYEVSIMLDSFILITSWISSLNNAMLYQTLVIAQHLTREEPTLYMLLLNQASVLSLSLESFKIFSMNS